MSKTGAKVKVIIAIGSNLGNRADNLNQVIEFLKEAVDIESRSKIYETAPMYVEDQPEFLNMAVAGFYDGEPADLLAFLKATEQNFGRTKNIQYGPRIIDLDIIFFGENMVYESNDLMIPHPKMQERDFVLAPMMDICSDWVHPVLGKSVSELFDAIDSTAKIYTE